MQSKADYVWCSYLIWSADTWLHVTVETVVYTQVSPSSPPTRSFGYQIEPSCSGWFNNTEGIGVIQSPSPSETERCNDGQNQIGVGAYQIMNKVSDIHQVLTSSHNGAPFSFLAPAHPPADLDFRTSTFAIGSSCQLLTQPCNLRVSEDDLLIQFN